MFVPIAPELRPLGVLRSLPVTENRTIFISHLSRLSLVECVTVGIVLHRFGRDNQNDGRGKNFDNI